MQVEITLSASNDADYTARDLGFLLHKHPDHLHEREIAAGKVSIFYPEVAETRTTALLYLDIDPVGLVRGKNRISDGLLTQYVNDRPYVANSFLSVAIARSFGQTMAGKSKERQELADQALSLEARVVPVAAAGGTGVIETLFSPLGYQVSADPLTDSESRCLFDLHISGVVRLRDLLNHLYVLVPVLDNAKHYWIDVDEVEKLLDKGEGWLADHPAKDLITRSALKHRRALSNMALARLAEGDDESSDRDRDEGVRGDGREETFEQPIRLHDLRLDTVLNVIKEFGASSVLDLGCGEGRLISRLLKERGLDRIVGVDPSVQAIEKAARRLRLDQAGDALRARLSLQMGSLTYADRRWRGFDVATLVEVIEHIDPTRLSVLEMSVFGDARPRLVVITTPNREYNALFDGMTAGEMRHPDHRFEWTRTEFSSWCQRVASQYGYSTDIQPIGPVDERLGGPSQMAVFTRLDGK